MSPYFQKAQEKRADKSLHGTTILVTRAAGQAPALSSLLRERGARVVEAPMIEVCPPRSWKPLHRALRNVHEFDWLILTSVNGVLALLQQLRRLKISKNKLQHLKIAAIGPATRDAILDAGLRVQVTPKEYVAEAVVAALRSRVRGKRVLLVRASVARDVIPRELKKAGARVEVVAAYQTKVPSSARAQLKKIMVNRRSRPNVLTFTSSSTARNFAQGARGMDLAGLATASIGPITSATLRECGFKVDIEAAQYTTAGLAKAIVAWARKHS